MQGWISSSKWSEIRDSLAKLAENLFKYANYLEAQNEKVLALQHASAPARSVSEAISMYTLPKQDAQSQSTLDTLLPVYNALTDKPYYEPVFLNDFAPTEARDRYHFIQLLKTRGCPAEAVLYTYSTGNNQGNYHFVWLIPPVVSADELQSQNASVVQKLCANMPQFHSRAMRQSFFHLFGRVANVKPAYSREIYRQLTDVSAASSENEKAIDERVQQALDLEDAKVVVDLRQHNKGQPSKYEPFWEACERYIHNSIDLAVDDRRHDRIAHLAIALSVNDLLSEVSKTVGPDIPVPSAQWLRLQFWPKTPTAQTALQYTGRLKVKFMVQKRQLRKYHEDAHYASAVFRYEKEMAIKYRTHATFLSLDDKHKFLLESRDTLWQVWNVERGCLLE